MTRRSCPSLLVLFALAAACSDSSVVGPGSVEHRLSARTDASDADAARVTVMTQNLYIGADVDVVVAALASADPTDDVPTLIAAVAVLQQTAFPARAERLADEIKRARPHVVGLQEVEQIHIDLTGLGVPVIIDQDFLAILQTALERRGMHYTVAGRVTNVTVVIPPAGISVVDEDAILVDAKRVAVRPGVTAHTYTANLGVVAPGVELKRGWVQIEAMVDGDPVTVASTHLESGTSTTPSFPALRAAQATELVASVDARSPAILLGDFNDTPGSPMYDVVTGAGFTDTWQALHPGELGFTCCEPPDLANPLPALSERIDYVFARGFGDAHERLRGKVTVVGDRSSDRLTGPSYSIWPSDHAGVVARLHDKEGNEVRRFTQRTDRASRF